jgi:malate synthase
VRADTLHGTFEIEEIIHELGDLVCEIEADYDGYLFSYVQAFHARPRCVLPDRADITPQTHLLRAYSRLLARVCERRGALLIGAMADAGTADGLDGDAAVEAGDLLHVPQGRITEDGIRTAIRTAIAWLRRCDDEAGQMAGSDPLDAAAAAELARAQLWQWVQQPTGVLDHGEVVTADLFRRLLDEESAAVREREDAAGATTRWRCPTAR